MGKECRVRTDELLQSSYSLPACRRQVPLFFILMLPLAHMSTFVRTIPLGICIEGKITPYIARHTWAMVQKTSLRNPTSMISDALGHKTEDVTRAYLESFKNEELDEMNRGIL